MRSAARRAAASPRPGRPVAAPVATRAYRPELAAGDPSSAGSAAAIAGSKRSAGRFGRSGIAGLARTAARCGSIVPAAALAAVASAAAACADSSASRRSCSCSQRRSTLACCLLTLSASRTRLPATATRKVLIPGVNHLFVPATTGAVDEYPTARRARDCAGGDGARSRTGSRPEVNSPRDARRRTRGDVRGRAPRGDRARGHSALRKLGLDVSIERGAGARAGFPDAAYAGQHATLGSRDGCLRRRYRGHGPRAGRQSDRAATPTPR